MSKQKVTISFKVSPADKQRITDHAFQQGLSMSQYCEGAILSHFDGHGDEYERRGDRVLSEDDLDAIAGRLSLELEALEFTRQPAPIEEDPLEGFFLADLLNELAIPEAWKQKISEYVATALENGMVDEEQVIIRMLAYSYQHLKPKYSLWSTEIKEVTAEELNEIFAA